MHQISAKKFISFMTSPAGRWLRVLIGVGMIYGGFSSDTSSGKILGLIGLIPFLAGGLDVCILAPLLGGYFSGPSTRQKLHQEIGHPEYGDKAHTWLKA